MNARNTNTCNPVTLILICAAILGGLSFIFLTFERGGRWDRYAGGGNFIGVRPSISPIGNELVYASPRTGQGDIYLTKVDGTSPKRLTFDVNYEGDPAWSFDGKKIAFVREHPRGSSIWIMDRDGTNCRRITDANWHYDSGPSFSPDGGQLVFSRVPMTASHLRTELYTIYVDGSHETRLTSNDRANWQAKYIPSTGEILYCVDSDEIRALDPSTGQSRLITYGSSPAIDADSNALVYIYRDKLSKSFEYDLFITDIEGQTKAQVTHTGGYKSDPAFWPDKQQVIFIQGISDNQKAVSVNLENHETHDLFSIK